MVENKSGLHTAVVVLDNHVYVSLYFIYVTMFEIIKLLNLSLFTAICEFYAINFSFFLTKT